jgi:hypothetical protein
MTPMIDDHHATTARDPAKVEMLPTGTSAALAALIDRWTINTGLPEDSAFRQCAKELRDALVAGALTTTARDAVLRLATALHGRGQAQIALEVRQALDVTLPTRTDPNGCWICVSAHAANGHVAINATTSPCRACQQAAGALSSMERIDHTCGA